MTQILKIYSCIITTKEVIKMIIFFREFSRNKKALITWTLSMVLFSVFLMTFFPTITEQADKLDELMEQYPKEIVEAFNFDRLRMSDPMGFYGGQIYIFITLFGSIYSILLFSGALSREESERTSEFLLTRPVRRTTIVSSKALAAFVNITLFNFIFGIANIILFDIYARGTFDKKILYLLILGPYIMHLFFGALGLLLSVFVVKTRTVYPLSIGFVILAYFISILSTLSEKAEKLKFLTPFKYVDAADIVTNKAFTDIYLLIVLGVIIISVLSTYIFYNKKDILS
jgi:ABC-2 type transport system permease protein